MKLIEGFDSNYRFILVAARRARQLQSGAKPLIETPARKASKIAQSEILAGKVKFVVGAKQVAAPTLAGDIIQH